MSEHYLPGPIDAAGCVLDDFLLTDHLPPHQAPAVIERDRLISLWLLHNAGAGEVAMVTVIDGCRRQTADMAEFTPFACPVEDLSVYLPYLYLC